jgi:Uma2 family endonuclease
MQQAHQKTQKYTYADYVQWDDDIRHELIDGVVYDMDAPSTIHQRISRRIFIEFANFLEGKKCEAFYAPFDVRLNPDTADDTVVQPDILVVCDPKKIGTKGCLGAPDLIVEILSPSSMRMDMHVKMKRYRAAGVREYWIVNPELQVVMTYLLNEGTYIAWTYGRGDVIPVSILDDFQLDLSTVFPPEEPPAEPEAETAPQ